MRNFVMAALALFAAGPASALSCLQVDVDWLYTRAAESADAFVPVVGTLSAPSMTPRSRTEAEFNAGETGTAWFSGEYVSQSGQLVPWSSKVLAQSNCVASWCGGLPIGQPILGFLRVTEGGYLFEGNACPTAIGNPTPDQIARLQACLQGADCTPDF